MVIIDAVRVLENDDSNRNPRNPCDNKGTLRDPKKLKTRCRLKLADAN